jgi:predicted 3-demethylubiquinone-9 3-methyltransferase (glyoxalase superfamily)
LFTHHAFAAVSRLRAAAPFLFLAYSIACKDQTEIDRYWDKLLEGGKPMACGWVTDRFGLCWQIVPDSIGEILKRPKAMAAMMNMVKFDIATLEAAAKE